VTGLPVRCNFLVRKRGYGSRMHTDCAQSDIATHKCYMAETRVRNGVQDSAQQYAQLEKTMERQGVSASPATAVATAWIT
jgi:hypothetical protein